MEVGTTKARTCSWILLRPSSPVKKLSKSYSAGAPTTRLGTWESQRKAPAPVPRWFPLSEVGCLSQDLVIPHRDGHTQLPVTRVSLHQLLPLCSASPSHRQLVWGTTLQKRKHIDLTVHWGTRLLCSLENMTYKG